MHILVALKQEQAKLQQQLKGIQGAILALNGSHTMSSRTATFSHKTASPRRVMSAAARAKISKATKARWAKFRAEKLREQSSGRISRGYSSRSQPSIGLLNQRSDSAKIIV